VCYVKIAILNFYDVTKTFCRLRVFDEISFHENFAKLATKRFSCFAKMRDEFREFCSFAKLLRLRKKGVSRNTKIAKAKKT
jgi:hypothetical protein